MEALIVLLILVVVGVLIAVVASKRGSHAPTAPSYSAPTQLDPDDFIKGNQKANVVMFGSKTCTGCAEMSRAIETLSESQESVVSLLIMNEDRPELFTKYSVDGIPSTLIVDEAGVVSDSFFGPTSTERLLEAYSNLGSAS